MRTNRLQDPKFDYMEIAKRFHIYQIGYKGYAQRMDISDRIKSVGGVYSIVNGTDSVHVLTGCDDSVRDGLFQALFGNDRKRNEITFTDVYPGSVSKRVMLQLLISMLNRADLENEPSNVSGRFFIVLRTVPNKRQGIISEIVALEFTVLERGYRDPSDPDLYLTVHVRTFTNYKLKNLIKFDKKRPPESYPKYVLDGLGLRRKNENDEGDAFILRRIGTKKTRVKFTSFTSFEEMATTKNWFISEVEEAFNLRYGSFAHLAFCDEPELITIHPKLEDMTKGYEARVNEALRAEPIILLNRIGADGEEALSALKERFIKRGFDVREQMQTEFSNIVDILHDKDYYQRTDLQDPYRIVPFTAVQHVTAENFSGSVASCDEVATNLAIKNDILKGQISLDHWDYGRLSFAIKLDDREDLDARFALMNVDSDGSISFMTSTPELCGNEPLGTAMMVKGSCGAVIRGTDVNLITETDIITLPDIQSIRKKMKENLRRFDTEDNSEGTGEHTDKRKRTGIGNGIRTKEGRKEYLSELVDITAMPAGKNRIFYAVGKVGEGVNSDFPFAVNVRMVEAWEGSELFIEGLLGLMNVPFVRHKQPTVLPYPFKYLREWCYMNGYLDLEEESDCEISEDQP